MKRRQNDDFMKEAAFKQYLYMDNTHYIDYWNGTLTLRIRMAGNARYYAQELERGPKHYDITQRMTSKLILHMVERLEETGEWPNIWATAWGLPGAATPNRAPIIPFTTGAA